MFSRKKYNRKNDFNKSLSDDIMQELKSCYIEKVDVAGHLKSYAKQNLSQLFANVNKMYSSVRIKLSSLRNIDSDNLNGWQKDYENFTKGALLKFGNECNKLYDSYISSEVEDVFRDIIDSNNSFISKLSSIICEQLTKNPYNPVPGNIFLVHGHGLDIRNFIADKLKEMGYNPIILDREIKTGTTVLEKFISYANESSKAIIFMTADDKIAKEKNEYYQARPNVFIELGYFLGIMDKRDIIIIKQDEASISSDIGGVVYEPYSNNEKELFKRIIAALNIK